MTRAIVLLCVLFLACDQRADELLVASIQAVLEDPPRKPSGHAADCAKGASRMAAPGIVLTLDCRPMVRDGGRR